jgi:hypothetical protein
MIVFMSGPLSESSPQIGRIPVTAHEPSKLGVYTDAEVVRLVGTKRDMTLGMGTFRIAALVVLLTSFSDYWAYDRFDPAAPMNSSGPEAVAVLDLDAPSGVGLQSSNLPDDRCVCCSPVIWPPGPVVPQPTLSTPSVNDVPYPVLSAELKPVAISTSPPLRDPTGFDRLLRV